MINNTIDYLEGLNPAQRDAVVNYQGATLIIAGAGSGKTKVLTMRIAYMLQQGVKPYNILALTFTNKAAREMKERISKILPYQATRGMSMGTFHSVFCRILRAESELLGFPESFTIYDTADSRNVVKAIIKEMELPDDRYKPNEVYSRISLAKNNLILPDAYASNQQLIEEDNYAKRPEVKEIYKRYFARCKQNGAMDFDDMLLYMNILLRDNPAVVEKYGSLFQYILVDEYQDTNFSQYLIVKKLASINHNICVVGDDSQSIYSFRGARIENILRFQKDNPDCKIFKLEQNYRSTSNIVNAANSVIEKNTRKLPKQLFSANEGGDKIKVLCAQSDKEEGLKVASDIHTTMYSDQAVASEFAIMYRTNAQSRVIEEYLRTKSIPYRIYGGHSFFQRAEVKDMIAYLRMAVNPRDDEALKRIINFPPRGIGDTSIQRIEEAARANNVSMWDVLNVQTPAQMGLRGPAVKSLGSFVAIFQEIAQKSEGIDAYELAMEVAQRSGVIQHYKMSRAIEDESRLQNTEELLNSIKEFVDAPQPDAQASTADAAFGTSSAQASTADAAFGTSSAQASTAYTAFGTSSAQESTADAAFGTSSAQASTADTAFGTSSAQASTADTAFGTSDQSADFGDGGFTTQPQSRTISAWLQDVSLLTDMDTADDDNTPRVTLLTVHASKGLEFKYTYIVGLEENLFPSSRGVETLDNIEEERRLFYVALTRAEKRIVLSFATSRFKWGSVTPSNPSRFIKEIDPQYLDMPKMMDYLTTNDEEDGIQQNARRSWQKFSENNKSSQSESQGGGVRAQYASKPRDNAQGAPVVPPVGFKKVQQTAAKPVSVSASQELTLGARVNHARFGVGTIRLLEQTSSDTRVTVDFGAGSEKVLLAKFAKLTVVE